jgi:hypothetical protein
VESIVNPDRKVAAYKLAPTRALRDIAATFCNLQFKPGEPWRVARGWESDRCFPRVLRDAALSARLR